LDHDEFTIFLFILEHLALVGIGFSVLIGRLLRTRKERRDEMNSALRATDRQQVAEMREEMTQLREMMADLLIDRHDRQTEAVAAEQRPEDTLPRG